MRKADKLSRSTTLNTENKMTRDLQELQYCADIQALLHLCKKWQTIAKSEKKKKEAKEIYTMVGNVFIYVAGLHLERRSFDSIIDDLRKEKWIAIKEKDEYIKQSQRNSK